MTLPPHIASKTTNIAEFSEGMRKIWGVWCKGSMFDNG